MDDKTGEPVSRETMYAHAFNDSLGKQVSLKPGGDDRFELCIAGPEIRLRIPDLSDTYFLFEQDYAVEGSMLDIEVRLKPTHWILLHGTMQWEDGNGDLHPLYEGGAIARKASLSAGPVGLSPFDDGHYSVRAPRKLLEFLSINTSYVHSPRVVDLRGETGDEYELNFVFRPSGLDD
ncbi:MAG: hypothetical protein GY930_22365 [bacterium]|nr:hypothetical protein [bacterium]